MRTAITDKWQRNANDRRDSQIHADVNHHLNEKPRQIAQRKQLHEIIHACQGLNKQTPENHAKTNQNNQDAEKTKLFADGRKNKVSPRRRQKPELSLGALPKTLTEKPARTQSNQSLVLAVRNAERVFLRPQKTRDPEILLFREKKLPAQTDKNNKCQRKPENLLGSRARSQKHEKPDAQKH